MRIRSFRRRRSSPVMAFGMLGLVFTCIGVVFLIITNSAKAKVEAARNWPETSGSILKAWVEEDVNRDSDGRTDRDYTPRVEYQYQVDGRTFTGQQLSFGFQRVYGTDTEAWRALEAYPIGGSVSVYYNPEKPSEAVLDRELGGGALGPIVGYGGIGLGVIFLLLAVIRLFLGLGRKLVAA